MLHLHATLRAPNELAAAIAHAERRLAGHVRTLATLLLQYAVDLPQQATMLMDERRHEIAALRDIEAGLKTRFAANGIDSLQVRSQLAAVREQIAPLAEESDDRYLAAHRIVVDCLSARAPADLLAMITRLPPESERFAENYACVMQEIEALCLRHAASLEQGMPAAAHSGGGGFLQGAAPVGEFAAAAPA
ncbi:hypothetical protein [Noviherbaspirillum pedocola]|uniref:Uncharacterized protein n=1 Tax=Noviherbaspirillum pedocola TaxID=2801341 RepID=A0A934W8K3_9BURK|nr:hypothetical protein [Noviherbaspirillum pedocola]MBK4735924.1 hypothetical protein [Noviherbaspirillum pedocola]